MRVAFLFIEQCPNYDLVFQILSRLTVVEFRRVNTYVRAGLWNTYNRGKVVSNIFTTQQENIWDTSTARYDAMNLLSTEMIYSVIFESLDKNSTLELHKRMENYQYYLGFTQILPIISHLHVFALLNPLLKIENGNVYVLYSELGGDESESLADEIVEWVNQEYNNLTLIHLTSNLKKKDVGSRFSIFDVNENSVTDRQVQDTINFIGDEWNLQSEQVFFAAYGYCS